MGYHYHKIGELIQMDPMKSMPEDYKYCDNCAQILSKTYPDNLCPICRETVLLLLFCRLAV